MAFIEYMYRLRSTLSACLERRSAERSAVNPTIRDNLVIAIQHLDVLVAEFHKPAHLRTYSVVKSSWTVLCKNIKATGVFEMVTPPTGAASAVREIRNYLDPVK